MNMLNNEQVPSTSQCVVVSGVVRIVVASTPEMADKWTHTNTASFIENFKQFTCLFKVASVEYKNSDARQADLQNAEIVM